MSYRELRKILRVLGFPRMVSIENFRGPNFPLVAEILHWMSLRFDPNINIPLTIDSEKERVLFIRTISQLMATKGNIKLNTKKLYQADGRAVQELLKGVMVLYTASQVTSDAFSANNDPSSNGWEINDTPDLNESQIRSKMEELKKSRHLATEITMKGANLHDALSKEIQVREQRIFAVSRSLNLADVEETMKDGVSSEEKEVNEITNKISNVASDEASLDSKIEKRREDLERYKKRLDVLKSVRPAFMDEFEKLEQELAYVYDLYVLKYRCLVFLEQQLEEVEKTEMDQVRKREEDVRGMISTAAERSLFEENMYDRASNTPKVSDDEMDSSQGDPVPANNRSVQASSGPGGTRKTSNTGASIMATSAVAGAAGVAVAVASTSKAGTGDRASGGVSRRGTGRLNARTSFEQTSLDDPKDDSLDSDIDLEDEASDLDSEDEMDLLTMDTKTGLSSIKNAHPMDQAGKLDNSDDDF